MRIHTKVMIYGEISVGIKSVQEVNQQQLVMDRI